MGLFEDIGNGIAAVVDSVTRGVDSYQDNRRASKKIRQTEKTERVETRAERDIAKYAIKHNAKTLSGLGTGESAYSSPGETFTGLAAFAEPVAGAVSDVASAGMWSSAFSAFGAAGSSVAGAVDAAGSAAGAPGVAVSTPVGTINGGTLAIVGIAAVGLLLLNRSGT